VSQGLRVKRSSGQFEAVRRRPGRAPDRRSNPRSLRCPPKCAPVRA
jgi:hypothetical protein